MNALLPWRPTIAFVMALAMWAPTASAFVHGNLDVAPTGIRFLLALGASWLGVTLLAIVVGGYGHRHEAMVSETSEPEGGTLDE